MSPISRARITVLTTLAMLAGIGASVPGVAAASGARRAPQVTIKKFGNVTYKTFMDGSGNTVPMNFDVYVPQDLKSSDAAPIMQHGEGWVDG